MSFKTSIEALKPEQVKVISSRVNKGLTGSVLLGLLAVGGVNFLDSSENEAIKKFYEEKKTDIYNALSAILSVAAGGVVISAVAQSRIETRENKLRNLDTEKFRQIVEREGGSDGYKERLFSYLAQFVSENKDKCGGIFAGKLSKIYSKLEDRLDNKHIDAAEKMLYLVRKEIYTNLDNDLKSLVKEAPNNYPLDPNLDGTLKDRTVRKDFVKAFKFTLKGLDKKIENWHDIYKQKTDPETDLHAAAKKYSGQILESYNKSLQGVLKASSPSGLG